MSERAKGNIANRSVMGRPYDGLRNLDSDRDRPGLGHCLDIPQKSALHETSITKEFSCDHGYPYLLN
jgi:hypothetical protein